jgi:prolyl oligopeptidase
MKQLPRLPKSTKIPHVDSYHGHEVEDPYRWLEDDVRESSQVRAWVESQNAVTLPYLRELPARESLRSRLEELWDFEKRGAPFERGGRWFQFRNDGLQNHAVLYVGDHPQAIERILLDPNTWSEDGTVALEGLSFSKGGRYLAYGIQDGGSDWRTWRVFDVEHGQLLPDELRYLKFTGVSWEATGEGFFYSKYPDPEEGAQFQALNLENKVMYHRLGTRQEDDVIVYWRPEQPEWSYMPRATKDGRWLWLNVWRGTDPKHRIYVLDLTQKYALPMPLFDEFENSFDYVWNDGPLFYLRTDAGAPKSRIVCVDVASPEPANWIEIVPEDEAPLLEASFVGGRLVCEYLRDVKSAVELYTLDGQRCEPIEMPGLGTAAGFGGEAHDTQTFFSFSSFAIPPSIYLYDFVSGETELFWRAELDFDADAFVTEQRFVESKDGTRVPMFVTHRKGMELNGAQPTLLYGYGGFDVSLTPAFTVSRALWLEQGGVYVVANLRGGGEYGREWHEGGKRQNKQNVFDDFIAAAEHLIEAGYTSNQQLAIQGGSNGGLLVGACMCQRPELFAVALPAVGVMDMLRFDAFTAGRFWTDDYGSAQDGEEMFRYLLGYSPYHNLKPGTRYPATLVTTADTDDRVVPGHSFKFAARLQECQAGDAPTLIRIETRAGHGAGKPTWMMIEELADIYAFAFSQLRIEQD